MRYRMKQLFICFFLLFFSSALKAQLPGFPKSWEGNWKGSAIISSARGSQSVPVSLTIEPLDGSRWSWILYYNAPNQNPRRYELIQDDTGWKIDEKNGVVLPQQIIGERLTSGFSVEGSLLVCYYWLEGEVLNMEIHTVALHQNKTATTETGEPTAVSTHSVGTFQKAKLYRK